MKLDRLVYILIFFFFITLNSTGAANAQYSNQPLRQNPPPSNSPTSVQVGAPPYYYYYTPGAGYPPGYATPQSGVIFTNRGGRTNRTFWNQTPIPGPGTNDPNRGNVIFMP
jgi:hypothetical protein